MSNSSANGSSPRKNSIVLDAMLSLPETVGALDVIADALKTDHAVLLDVFDSLDRIQNTERYRWLLKAIPDMLWADYAILLWDHVCLPENYQLFVSSPGLFREITEFGRKCLFRFRSRSGEKIPKMANKSIQDEMPLLALNTDHKAIRRAAEQVGAKNPWFAEWWLLNELSYVEPLNLFGDAFENLVGMIDQEVPQFRKTSLGFQYLVERGNPSEERNLHRACNIVAANSGTEHWNLFFQLLDHWLTRGYAIPKEDIAFLILLLPERSATDGVPTLSSRQKRVEELLAKIVRSGTQDDSIVSLRATDACTWLTKTRGRQRIMYMDNGKDLLYQALLKHKRPGAILVWELWVIEKAGQSLSSARDWEDHVNIGNSLVRNLPRKLADSNKVKIYEKFADKLSSSSQPYHQGQDWVFNMRLILLKDTVLVLTKEIKVNDFPEGEWIAWIQFWLLLWQYEPDEWVKEQAVFLLKTYLPEESPEHLDQLGQRCLEEILAFVNHLTEKKLLPQKELDRLQSLTVPGEPAQKPSDPGKQACSPAAAKTRPTLPPLKSEDIEDREEIKTSHTHQNSHRAKTRPTFRPSVNSQMEQAGENHQTPQIDGYYRGHTGWDAEQSGRKEEKSLMIIVMVVVFLALLMALCVIFFTLPMVRAFISHLRILGG